LHFDSVLSIGSNLCYPWLLAFIACSHPIPQGIPQTGPSETIAFPARGCVMTTVGWYSFPRCRNVRAFMGISRLEVGVLSIFLGGGRPGAAAGAQPFKKPPTVFECRWTDGPIKIDGKANEEAWKHAQVIDNFYLPWFGKKARAARTATKARLLWDR